MRRNKFLPLTSEAIYLDQNHWFTFATFVIHSGTRSHTGAYATFGKGIIYCSAKGQQINTTRSTEAEVFKVHENMPAILWMRYFLRAQRYPLRPTNVHQGNLSGKRLTTNGRASSSKRARHMNIIYFFIWDVQKRQYITIEYCPPDEMIDSVFTKL